MKKLVIAALLLAPSSAFALPQYALRSGRTCGNCHVSPTYQDPDGWNNPDLAQRKCTMSCIACHTNPTGGGMRNVSGRYYGQSTLSTLNTQERSYSDYGRELISAEVRQALMSYLWTPANDGSAQRVPGTPIPSNYAQVLAGVGQGRSGGRTQWGRPFGSGPSEYAFWDGRYGDLNADPLLSLGGDLRAAYWSGSSTFFPMQLDLHASLHPLEHVTLAGTLAGRGRVSGPLATVTQDRLPFYARNAYAMVHELPFMAYGKAGIFMPGFGTYIDDHTSFTREYFEMDVSQSEDTVMGVELGVAPNYPYANVSAFTGVEDGGFGLAANVGWRDLAWSVGAHAMMKRRDAADTRRDLDALGLAWGFNPFTLSNAIPVTYIGELSFGRREALVTGEATTFYAMMHEVWVTLFNGVSLRLKYDLGSRGSDAGLQQRFVVGTELSPVTGFTLQPQVRLLVDRPDGVRPDFFMQAHIWF